MTTGAPEPQDELERELILTGNMEQLNALVGREARLSRGLTFPRPKRITLRLLGPVQDGESICWLVPTDMRAEVFLAPPRSGRLTIGWGGLSISVSPGMTLQQIYDLAVAARLEICLALHLGLLHVSPLPDNRLRLLFVVAGCGSPPIFWRWVDGLTAELDRLGFNPITSSGRPAAQAEPWLQVPEYRWDRRALELWWQGLTTSEIAARLGYTEKTIRNRLSALRATYGPQVVPTAAQLVKKTTRDKSGTPGY